jgi:Cu/Zn superoxide dismutase
MVSLVGETTKAGYALQAVTRTFRQRILRHAAHGHALRLAGVIALLLAFTGQAQAGERLTLPVYRLDDGKPSVPLGQIVLSDTDGGGVLVDPLLGGLPEGSNPFYIHVNGDCGYEVGGGHFNPVTGAVYDRADERGRMATDTLPAAASLARQNEHYRQSLLQPALVADVQMLSGGVHPLIEQSPSSRAAEVLALGDFPSLLVDKYGHATQISFAPIISVSQLYGRSLMIGSSHGQAIACAIITRP